MTVQKDLAELRAVSQGTMTTGDTLLVRGGIWIGELLAAQTCMSGQYANSVRISGL